MKYYSLTVLSILLLYSSCVSAQSTFRGRVLDMQAKPVAQAKIQPWHHEDISVYTNQDGIFEITIDSMENMPLLVWRGEQGERIVITAKQMAKNTDTTITDYVLMFGREHITYDDEPLISDPDYYNAGHQDAITYGILSNTHPHDAVAASHWLAAGYHKRNYSSAYQTVCINGMQVNDLARSTVPATSWGGLYDVIQVNHSASCYEASSFAAGNVAGAADYGIEAADYEKGGLLRYNVSNVYAVNQLTAAGFTGLTASGFAAMAAFTARFGNEGYVQGTPYYSYSYLLSLQQTLGKHNINLTALGAVTTRSAQAAVRYPFVEYVDNCYYNENWGYQSNKKRNATTQSYHNPIIVLSHTWHINTGSTWHNTLGATFGNERVTTLEWQNARAPYATWHNTEGTAYDLAARWQGHEELCRLDWNYMYQTNYMQAQNGLSAAYGLATLNRKQVQLSLSSVYDKIWNEQVQLHAGLQLQYQKARYYKSMTDLLGGNYWTDISSNAYGQSIYSTMSRNNLMNDSPIYEGDIYGYDYVLHTWKEQLWAQLQLNYTIADMQYAIQMCAQHSSRTGNMVNGRFENNSYGKLPYLHGIGAGIYAKINFHLPHKQYVGLHALVQYMPVAAANLYIAPQICNVTIPSANNEAIVAGDVYYEVKHQRVQAYLSVYMDYEMNHTQVNSFYSPAQNTPVHLASVANSMRLGCEAGVEIKLVDYLSLFMSGNIGDYVLVGKSVHNEANIYMLAYENNPDIISKYVGSSGYASDYHRDYATVGLKFSHATLWHAELAANYMGSMDVAYIPYVPIAYEQSNTYDELIGKGNGFTLDARLGKIFRVHNTMVDVTVAVNNLLNNKHVYSGLYGAINVPVNAYNSMNDVTRYHYMYGTTFKLEVSVKF